MTFTCLDDALSLIEKLDNCINDFDASITKYNDDLDLYEVKIKIVEVENGKSTEKISREDTTKCE